MGRCQIGQTAVFPFGGGTPGREQGFGHTNDLQTDK